MKEKWIKVRFRTPEDYFLFVEVLEAQEASKEETVRGYKIKVNYRAVGASTKAVRSRLRYFLRSTN